MKDYQIKEALSNLKQGVDVLKQKVSDLDAKIEILVDILNERLPVDHECSSPEIPGRDDHGKN